MLKSQSTHPPEAYAPLKQPLFQIAWQWQQQSNISQGAYYWIMAPLLDALK